MKITNMSRKKKHPKIKIKSLKNKKLISLSRKFSSLIHNGDILLQTKDKTCCC